MSFLGFVPGIDTPANKNMTQSEVEASAEVASVNKNKSHRKDKRKIKLMRTVLFNI